jgi:hypothetical protein
MLIFYTVVENLCVFYIQETIVTVFSTFLNASGEVLTPEVVKIPGMERRV